MTNLHDEIEDRDLKRLFEPIAPVLRIVHVWDARDLGFGHARFVDLPSADAAVAAKSRLDGHEAFGSRMRVELYLAAGAGAAEADSAPRSR